MSGLSRLYVRLFVLFTIVGLLVLVVLPAVSRHTAVARQSLAPASGDQLTETCNTKLAGEALADQVAMVCKLFLPAVAARGGSATTPTPSPTKSPAPSPTPTHDHGSVVGACGESMNTWHPPVINGCNAGHEHGDPPPAWIEAAGYQVAFHGHFNTSPAENTSKHAAMKGFATTLKGVDIYFRIHAASNPLDRSARYHSYEVWAHDPSGNVSHWQLWYNSGDPRPWYEGGSRVPKRATPLPEDAQRPIVAVIDEQSLKEGIGCEQWYSAPGEPRWGWDFGWTICGATTLYQPNENASAADTSTWKPVPDGNVGLQRRLEAAWYKDREHLTGVFVSTQFGEIVSGMSDPRCTQTTTKFGVTYQNVCLEQYIASSLPTVGFPNNADEKVFDGTGVHIPN